MDVCEKCGTVDERQDRLDQAEHHIRDFEYRLAVAEHRADELEAALRATRACLEDILASRFWRFTAPIRWTARGVLYSLRAVGDRARRAIRSASDRGQRAIREVRVLREVR